MPAVIIDVWQCPEYASPFCYTRLRKRKYSLSMIILLDFIYNYFYLFWAFPQNCNFNSFYLNVPLWFSWKVFGFLMFSGGIKWEHWEKIGLEILLSLQNKTLKFFRKILMQKQPPNVFFNPFMTKAVII